MNTNLTNRRTSAGRSGAGWRRVLGVGLLLLLLLALRGGAALAQSPINLAEYYLDTDPGFGAATAIPIATPATDLPNLTAAVNIGSLGTGFHVIGLRTRTASGAWSMTSRKTFYYEPAASTALADIDRVEYFLDSDPGLGNATSVTITAGPDISGLAFPVSIGSIGTGFHSIGFRSRTSSGQWSLTTRKTFYYEPAASAAVANINKVEYYLDTDPGFGLATDVPVTAGPDIGGLAFGVNIGALTTGFHSLGYRSRDSNGQWSLTARKTFYYEPASNTPLANVNRVEYYLDSDPGLGSATPVTGYAALTDVSGLAFTVDLTAVGTGFHSIGIRSRDANGAWSMTNRKAFYYEPTLLTVNHNLTRVEYYLDTDPGFGAATDVTPATQSFDLPGVAFGVNLSSLTTGFHTLNVRSKDDQNQWSLTNRKTFYYEPLAVAALPNIARIEYYFDTDPGFGSATAATGFSPAPDLNGVGVLADASALADGAHTLFIRSRDANGQWSLVSNRPFVKNGCGSSGNLAAGLPSANYTQGGSYYGGSAEAGFNNAAGSTNLFGSYNTGLMQADIGTGNLQILSDVRLRIVPQANTSLTLQIQTSANGTTFATVDTYTALLNANATYDIARTLATVANNVRFVRLVFGASPNAALAVTGVGAYFFNCTGPAIISFTPTGGAAGTSVNITGTNLAGVTGVRFNGTAVPLANITNNTATGLTVVAPAGGTSGQICLTATAGSTCSAQSFQYPPTIATGTVSPSAFCARTFITVPFTTNLSGYGNGNTFGFQLSDASGNFSNTSRIYNQTSYASGGGGYVYDTVDIHTPAGTGYRVRVVSSNPVLYGTPNAVNLTVYSTPVATASASSTTVAYNGSTTLTAGPTGQSNYTWYVRYTSNGGVYNVGSGQTLTLNNLQPTQSGRYFVYVSNATSCQDSASVYVLVQPSAQPIVAISQFGGGYCAGSSQLSFSFAVQGNSFPSGNTVTAQLSDASGSFAAPTVLGTVPFVGQGTGYFNVTVPAGTAAGSGYRVRVVASTAFVANPATNGTNLSINALPVAVAGSNSPVAYGGTIQLTAQNAGMGATYQWYGPGFYSALQNPTIANATTANNQGTYQLVVTLGGCSNSTTTSVVVSPSSAPILTFSPFSGGPYCAGSSTFNIGFNVTGNSFASGNQVQVQLSDASGSFGSTTVIGSVNFTGQGNGVVTASIPVSAAAGTAYRIRLVGTNPGVPSAADNGTNLSINAAPAAVITANNSPVPYNGTVTLTAQTVPSATYVWSVPGVGNVSTGSSPTLNVTSATPANSGTYTLTVTVGTCSSQTTAPVTVLPAGQPILAIAQFGGNPCAGGSVSFNFSVSGANLNGTVTAQLSDASGSFATPVSIGSTTFSGQGSGSIAATIPAGTAQGGLYRIRLTSSVAATVSPADNGSNISINATPTAAASSNSPVAAGGTLNLMAATTLTGTVYSWTGPNGYVAPNQQNPSLNNVTAANAGTYVLTATLGTCSTQSSTVVTVGAAVAAITTGSFGGSFCPGAGLTVPFTASGFSSGNVFTAQLSSASGSFGSPVNIGTVSGTGSGSIAAQIPLGTAAGSGYRIRVVGSSPATTSGNDNGTNLTVGAITFVWTGGNGSSNWFDPLNWSCGQVPTSTSVVVIPGSLTFYPVISGATAALALTLTVQSGATFTNSGTFNLYGNVTVLGTVNASVTSSWYFAGSGAQYLYGTSLLQVGNLYINSGSVLTMNNALYVSANWYNYGSFAGGTSYNVYFNGTGTTQVIGGSVATTFYNVYVNAGAVVNLGLGTTFLNNLVVNGTFGAAGYGVAFNGTVAQTIGGSGNATFYTVTINNLVSVTLVDDITVLGDWINNGVFVGGTYSVIFAGTVLQIIGGTAITNFYNLTLQNSAANVTLHQHIYVLGSFVNTGVFYGYYVTGGVTTGYYVRFGGTTAQVITANNTTYFYHFYVGNAAGVTLTTNIYIAGNYYLYSGTFAPGTFTVYFNGTGGYVQTVGGYTSLSFYGWNIGNGAYVRLIQDVTWLGNFVNAGTFYGYNLVGGVYTYYTSLFGGSGAQVVNGGGVYEFGHVTISNVFSGGVTFGSAVYVLGNWLNNGVFFAGTNTVFFNGPAAQLIGGSVVTTFHHLSIGNLVSVSLNQALTVTGNWLGSGVFIGAGYLVYFNGTAAQTVFCGSSTRFGNVRFNNPTTITLLSNIYLTGNWTNDGGFVANGYAVYFSGLATQVIAGTVLTTFHHLFVLNGATVQLGRAIVLTGNWTNGGAFLHGGYNVSFLGILAQTIGGTVVTDFFGILFNNPTTVTLLNSIRVAGTWTNNAGFAPGTFTVFFNGLVAQLIGGTASTVFYHLQIVNAVGVSLSAPIFIRGNLTNNGVFNCVGYLVTFDGTALQTIGGSSETVFGHLTCNNAGGVALGQNIRVRGDFRNLALFAAGGYTVYFDGTVAQGIFCPTGTCTFHHVVFANVSGVTLQNNVFLTGNWTNNGGFVANGKLVTFTGTALQTIGGTVATTFHHFTILTGATVRQLLGLTILGDWTNGGIFQHNNLLVYFNGTALQTLGGTALTTFYDVTFNNPVNVQLGYDIDVIHNFINSGGYCGCGHRTRFNGIVPQTITCTTGRTHFHDITFDNGAGIMLLNGIYVSGLWVNNGGYIANGQTVIFDGTALQTIGGTVLTAFYNIGITNAVNVQLIRDISVGGNWNNTGIFTGNGFGVTFNGTALQTIFTGLLPARSTFHHVTWASPAGCTLGGDVYVRGNWLCNGPFNPATWTVYFNGTTAQTCGGSAQLNFHGLTCSNPTGVTYNGPVYLTGNFSNTGRVNCGANAWYCTGTAAQTLGGVSATPTRFYDLLVQNASGVACTDNLGVAHVLTLTTGNLAANDHLTLHSDATGTAMVVNPATGGLVTGPAKMERFISGLGSVGYRHYASPMKTSAGAVSTTVQEFADDLPVFELNPAYNTVGNSVRPFPTLFKYDETRLSTGPNNYFDRGFVVPASNEDLQPLRGYSAMTDPTTVVDIRGVLQTGNVSLSTTRGTPTEAGWQLLGNPYPAPMDWDVVRNTPGMLTNVADALYVFEPTGRYTGTYKAYVNGLGQNGGSKDLAAMQGYFVRATGSGSVALTNAVRATTYRNPAFNRTATGQPAANGPQVLRLAVAPAADLQRDDEAVLYFEPGAALGFSPKHDAYKAQLNPDRPTLWTSAGPESFAINGLPDLATAPVVPLGVRVAATGPYVLTLTAGLNLPAGTQVWLEDRALGRRQNLAQQPTYAFTMAANFTGQRFFLNFVSGRPTAVTTGTLEARTALYPNPATAHTTLELAGLREQGPVKVELVNVLGQTVQTTSVRPHQGAISQVLDLRELPVGVYTVRVHTPEGPVVKRLVRE